MKTDYMIRVNGGQSDLVSPPFIFESETYDEAFERLEISLRTLRVFGLREIYDSYIRPDGRKVSRYAFYDTGGSRIGEVLFISPRESI